MPDYSKLLANVRTVNGRLTAPLENEPGQYQNRGYPWDNPTTTRHYQEYAKYASDYFVNVDAQGLDPKNPFKWEKVTLRMADLVKTSAAMQREFDNHKLILLDAMKYAYIPRGAKFVLMGSTWLCTNPQNISGSDGMGVVQRCNAVWNHLDWYGNVVSEPMAAEGAITRANAPDPQYNMPVVKGYYNVKCQYNPDTAQIDDNTRMMFGTSVYVVTGFSDFLQEFTGDYGSIKMLEFTIRKDEVNDTTDDRVNHVAGGKTFRWDISITGPGSVPVGNTVTLNASSLRCGETVVNTAEHPVTYLWSVSDESIATVDENGTVTALAEGDCTVTATLKENPAYSETFDLKVAGSQTGLAWETTPPEVLGAYQNFILTVLTPDNGASVAWNFSGADPNSYSYHVSGRNATVACWSGSVEPLTVTAEYNGDTISAVIPLNGI